MRIADGAAATKLSRGLWVGALLVMTGLAALLTVPGLGEMPFSRDEVASITDAHRSLGGTWDVVRHREANMWPYYLLLNGWTRLGTGETFVRLPTALFAVATVPLAMVLARRTFGDAAAVACGLGLALSTMLLDAGQEARAYALVALLAVASTLLLVEGVRRPRTGLWVAYGLVAALMVHCHMLSSLVIVAQLASLLFLPRAEIPFRELRIGVVVLAVGVAPMAFYALTKDSGQTSWIPAVDAYAVGGFARSATGGDALIALYALLFAAVAAGLVSRLRTSGRSRETWLEALVLLWVVLPPAALAIISVVKPLFTTQYLTGVVPGVALLLGLAVARLRPPRLALGAGALVLALTAVSAARHGPPFPKSATGKAAAQYVLERARPGDGVAYGPAFTRVEFDWYLRRLAPGRPGAVVPVDLDVLPGSTPQTEGDLFAREAPAADVARRMAGAPRIWLISVPNVVWHPTPEPVLAVGPAILRRSFTASQTQRFGDLTVRLYTRRVAAPPHT
ncbi:MAG TPA: glycosyltransferase family 39 protein [Baekduia sp.]|uniref:glycosyltransferase family 39 protein n=1 Tax=Baekduia sp. TaxID=2600305 RepID=UPI002C0DBF38|nr:glycosyltransferase family 39 protein [Baekduia sp.]HMJ33197.1 glycosyltransferase family 39 protein [Baekduia sp.]